MDELFLVKINRGLFLSLLTQKKILDAYNTYKTYVDYIKNYKITQKLNKNLKQQCDDELEKAKDIFYTKLEAVAEECYLSNDFSNALMGYTIMYDIKLPKVEVLKHYVTCLCKEKQFDLAIEVLHIIDKISPDIPIVLDTLADLYSKFDEHKMAIKYKERYLAKVDKSKIEPTDYNSLAVYYSNLYRVDYDLEIAKKSLKLFQKASELNPKSMLYAKNITVLATLVNDFDLAKKYWNKCFELNQITHDDEYDFAGFSMTVKDFDNYHKYFDSRFLKNKPTVFPKLEKPKWNGVDDISNSTLLIHHEQGFGDTFWTAGYMHLIKKYAKKVIFAVQPAVYELLANSDLGVEIVDSTKPLPEYDYYLPSMSIPIALKLKDRELSVGGGYIKADKKLVEEFNAKYFNNKKFKIGLSLCGNSKGDLTRDIPVEALKLLDSLKDIELYSLTKGIPTDTYKCFKHNKVHDLGNQFKTFSETAAAIENLDLVLSSDNGIMNLAGALGSKTLCLFNWHYQFRWFDLTGDDVVLYTSVKPIVNEAQNVWEPSVKKAVDEINKLRNV